MLPDLTAFKARVWVHFPWSLHVEEKRNRLIRLNLVQNSSFFTSERMQHARSKNSKRAKRNQMGIPTEWSWKSRGREKIGREKIGLKQHLTDGTLAAPRGTITSSIRYDGQGSLQLPKEISERKTTDVKKTGSPPATQRPLFLSLQSEVSPRLPTKSWQLV